MKTIREHIESLPALLRDKAMKVGWTTHNENMCYDSGHALTYLHEWGNTSDGFYFWIEASVNKMHALYSIKAVSGAYKKLFVVNIPVLDSPEKWMKQHYPGFRIVETHNEALIW
jgi:hypothetical protein